MNTKDCLMKKFILIGLLGVFSLVQISTGLCYEDLTPKKVSNIIRPAFAMGRNVFKSPKENFFGVGVSDKTPVVLDSKTLLDDHDVPKYLKRYHNRLNGDFKILSEPSTEIVQALNKLEGVFNKNEISSANIRHFIIGNKKFVLTNEKITGTSYKLIKSRSGAVIGIWDKNHMAFGDGTLMQLWKKEKSTRAYVLSKMPKSLRPKANTKSGVIFAKSEPSDNPIGTKLYGINKDGAWWSWVIRSRTMKDNYFKVKEKDNVFKKLVRLFSGITLIPVIIGSALYDLSIHILDKCNVLNEADFKPNVKVNGKYQAKDVSDYLSEDLVMTCFQPSKGETVKVALHPDLKILPKPIKAMAKQSAETLE